MKKLASTQLRHGRTNHYASMVAVVLIADDKEKIGETLILKEKLWQQLSIKMKSNLGKLLVRIKKKKKKKTFIWKAT